MAKKRRKITDDETLATVGELRDVLSRYPDAMPVQIGDDDSPLVVREHLPGSGRVFDPQDTEPDTDATHRVLVLQNLEEAETAALEQDGFVDEDLEGADDLEDEEDDPFVVRSRRPRRRKSVYED